MPSPTAIGRAAEGVAAAYLEQRGYTVLDRNWRNRWCEIDLVVRTPAGHADEIHIVEVKYRRNPAYGLAVEYVSSQKAARLMRAALAWTQSHRYTGSYQISVVAVDGPISAPTITFVPNAISA